MAKGLGLTTVTGYTLVDTTLESGITNTYTTCASIGQWPQLVYIIILHNEWQYTIACMYGYYHDLTQVKVLCVHL